MLNHPQILTLVHADADVKLSDRLHLHLRSLERAGVIRACALSRVTRGVISKFADHCLLTQTTLFVPILSPEFFASPSCVEQLEAGLERVRAGRMLLMPISGRAVDLEGTALAGYAAVNHAGRPLAAAPDLDAALRVIVGDIRRGFKPQPRDPAPEPIIADQPLKRRVLCLFAGPVEEVALSLGREREIIERHLSAPEFHVDFCSATTVDRVHEALLSAPYDLVHFSGHHSSAGLIFEDRCGRPDGFDGQLFLKMLSRRPSIRTLVLNACDSLALASGCDTLDYVIAMDGPVEDEAAVEFSSGFYRALSCGCPVGAAFADARDLAKRGGRRIRPHLLGRCASRSTRTRGARFPLGAPPPASSWSSACFGA